MILEVSKTAVRVHSQSNLKFLSIESGIDFEESKQKHGTDLRGRGSYRYRDSRIDVTFHQDGLFTVYDVFVVGKGDNLTIALLAVNPSILKEDDKIALGTSSVKCFQEKDEDSRRYYVVDNLDDLRTIVTLQCRWLFYSEDIVFPMTVGVIDANGSYGSKDMKSLIVGAAD